MAMAPSIETATEASYQHEKFTRPIDRPVRPCCSDSEVLDSSQMRGITENLYQLYPDPDSTSETDHFDVEIVVFHGAQPPDSNPEHAFWRTWKISDKEECWLETKLPRFLLDKKDKSVRVVAASYESRPDLRECEELTQDEGSDRLISEKLASELLQARIGQREGSMVFLVGHDLGGVLVKSLVVFMDGEARLADEREELKLRRFLENLTGVFFFAVPHRGANYFEKLLNEIPRDSVHPSYEFVRVLNREKGRINEKFQIYRTGSAKVANFTTDGIHATRKTRLGKYGLQQVVPEGSARSDVDHFYSDDKDHFQVCQLSSKKHYDPYFFRALGDRIDKAVKRDDQWRAKAPAPAAEPRRGTSTNPDMMKSLEARFPDPRKVEEVLCESTTAASSNSSSHIRVSR